MLLSLEGIGGTSRRHVCYVLSLSLDKERTKETEWGLRPSTPARLCRALFGALDRGAIALLMRASKVLPDKNPRSRLKESREHFG